MSLLGFASLAVPLWGQTGAQRDAVSSKTKAPVRPDMVREVQLPPAPEVPPPAAPKAPVVAVPEGQIQIISPANALYERGELLFRQRKYPEALASYRDLVTRFPTARRREEALYRLAECYRLLGRSKDAFAAYQYFLQAYPTSLLATNARLRVGHYLYQEGKYAESTATLQPVLTAEKVDPTIKAAAQYLLALGQLQSGEDEAGITSMRAILQNTAAKLYWPAAVQALAQTLEKAGRPEEALEYWKQTLALAKDPNVQAMAAARAGWLAMQLEKPKEAERLFERARVLAKSGEWRVAANSGLFRLYATQQRHRPLLELAEKERGRFLDSMRPELVYGVPAAHYGLEQYGLADQGFQDFLKAYPDHEIAPFAAYQRLVARSQVAPDGLLADTEAYVTAYPRAPYLPLVFYLRAQALSRAEQFAEAEKLWRNLQGLTGELVEKIPRDEIQFELARALYEQEKWPAAADAYLKFAEDFSTHDSALPARIRAAIALQNAQRPEEALRLWETVLLRAPEKTASRQMALEQIGLLAEETGKKDRAVEAFGQLLEEFPQSKVAGFANFILGDHAFTQRDYAKAEPLLLEARKLDATSHYLPATERLALLAFAQEEPEATRRYRAEYDASAAKANAAQGANPLPAALYFWLGRQAVGDKQFARAAEYFQIVAQHPQPGDFAVPVWWELAEAQRLEGRFGDAVKSYERYRQQKPDLANATEVLLALARAQKGASALPEAQELVEKAMVQTPEGTQNARARELLGEILLARGEFAQAAKVFSTLSVLYEDPEITPRALERAGEAYQRAGQPEKAMELQQELRRRYPDYRS